MEALLIILLIVLLYFPLVAMISLISSVCQKKRKCAVCKDIQRGFLNLLYRVSQSFSLVLMQFTYAKEQTKFH